nr:AAA+ ATPase domain-containing protein [Tanacetum cinerariifolium]
MATVDTNHFFVQEKKHVELKFDKNYKDVIITSCLPFIVEKALEIKNQKKVVKLHNLKSPYLGQSNYRQMVNLDHPSTFDTLAMDQKMKKEIIDDLDLFILISGTTKVILSADDNIISDDPDVALELAKSISQTKAEEAEAIRKVYATHARIMTESVPESAKKKSSGRSSKSVVIQDTPNTLNLKHATSKTKLKCALSLTLQEQEAANIMKALNKFIDEDIDDDKKDDKDGDANDKGDDHISDTQDADDETEYDEDDIYKYKICVSNEEDVEIKDAKVEKSNKGEEKVTDAAKTEAEKTSEAKDDT